MCERCESKSKAPGKSICDKCNFDLRIEHLKHQKELRERFLPRRRRVEMDEIFVGGRITATADIPIQRSAHPFEVSYLTKSGMRATERYNTASAAQKRFDDLKEKNIAGLRYWGITSQRRIELGVHNGQHRL